MTNTETDSVRWYVICVVSELNKDTSFGVVNVDQVLTGYDKHEHRPTSVILADLDRGIGYATATLDPDQKLVPVAKDGRRIVPGARIHAVHATKGTDAWLATDPNSTTRDNLGVARWCDEIR